MNRIIRLVREPSLFPAKALLAWDLAPWLCWVPMLLNRIVSRLRLRYASMRLEAEAS
jgi:hypothetical protein